MNEQELEKLRKKALICAVIGTIICVFLPVLVGFTTKGLNATVAAIILSMLIKKFLNKPYKDFDSNFKKMFVVEALESTFTDLKYEPDEGIDESVIESTNMIRLGDRYRSSNLITGKYKDVYLKQADVHIEKIYSAKNATYYITLFKGRWMIFDFNKNFKANMVVRQNQFRNSKGTGIFSGLHKVITEDESFNKQFKIYAEDDHEAFYILTPSLMEKIKDVACETSGNLILCFVDNSLHVGVHNKKNSFKKHNLFTKINPSKIRREVNLDIELITDFVDKLSLDNTLFKRSITQ